MNFAPKRCLPCLAWQKSSEPDFTEEDFRLNFVKILINPSGFIAFLPRSIKNLLSENSATWKMSVFGQILVRKTKEGWRLLRMTIQKMPKTLFFRRVRITPVRLVIGESNQPRSLENTAFLCWQLSPYLVLSKPVASKRHKFSRLGGLFMHFNIYLLLK